TIDLRAAVEKVRRGPDGVRGDRKVIRESHVRPPSSNSLATVSLGLPTQQATASAGDATIHDGLAAEERSTAATTRRRPDSAEGSPRWTPFRFPSQLA